MAFGIGGSDRFKSYSSNADAGGGMGVFAKRVKKDDKKKKDEKKEEESMLEMTEDQDDDNLIIEGYDEDLDL